MPEKFEPINSPFQVKDCALTTIATGYMARTLLEFHEVLEKIPAECIYYHFWRQTIDSSLAEGSFYNDFSQWAHARLHDDFLAERLTWINPTEYSDLELLRSEMLQITKKRINEQEKAVASLEVLPFYFVKSSIVIFNTEHIIHTPKELVKILPDLSKSSIFYHFIDGRRRQFSKQDDFTLWLQGYGENFQPLIQSLSKIDPYFISLFDLQKKLTAAVTEYFLEKCKGDFHESST